MGNSQGVVLPDGANPSTQNSVRRPAEPVVRYVGSSPKPTFPPHAHVWKLKVLLRGSRKSGKTTLLHLLEGGKSSMLPRKSDIYAPTQSIQSLYSNWSYKASEDCILVDIWDVVDNGIAERIHLSKFQQLPQNHPYLKLIDTSNHINFPQCDSTTVDIYKQATTNIIVIDPFSDESITYASNLIEEMKQHLTTATEMATDSSSIKYKSIDTLFLVSFSDQIYQPNSSELDTVKNHKYNLVVKTVQKWAQELEDDIQAITGQQTTCSVIQSSLIDNYGIRQIKAFMNIPFLRSKKFYLEEQLQSTNTELKTAKDEITCLLEEPQTQYRERYLEEIRQAQLRQQELELQHQMRAQQIHTQGHTKLQQPHLSHPSHPPHPPHPPHPSHPSHPSYPSQSSQSSSPTSFASPPRMTQGMNDENDIDSFVPTSDTSGFFDDAPDDDDFGDEMFGYGKKSKSKKSKEKEKLTKKAQKAQEKEKEKEKKKTKKSLQNFDEDGDDDDLDDFFTSTTSKKTSGTSTTSKKSVNMLSTSSLAVQENPIKLASKGFYDDEEEEGLVSIATVQDDEELQTNSAFFVEDSIKKSEPKTKENHEAVDEVDNDFMFHDEEAANFNLDTAGEDNFFMDEDDNTNDLNAKSSKKGKKEKKEKDKKKSKKQTVVDDDDELDATIANEPVTLPLETPQSFGSFYADEEVDDENLDLNLVPELGLISEPNTCENDGGDDTTIPVDAEDRENEGNDIIQDADIAADFNFFDDSFDEDNANIIANDVDAINDGIEITETTTADETATDDYVLSHLAQFCGDTTDFTFDEPTISNGSPKKVNAKEKTKEKKEKLKEKKKKKSVAISDDEDDVLDEGLMSVPIPDMYKKPTSPTSTFFDLDAKKAQSNNGSDDELVIETTSKVNENAQDRSEEAINNNSTEDDDDFFNSSQKQNLPAKSVAKKSSSSRDFFFDQNSDGDDGDVIVDKKSQKKEKKEKKKGSKENKKSKAVTKNDDDEEELLDFYQ